MGMGKRKCLASLGFETWRVQRIVSRFTDYVVLTPPPTHPRATSASLIQIQIRIYYVGFVYICGCSQQHRVFLSICPLFLILMSKVYIH